MADNPTGFHREALPQDKGREKARKMTSTGIVLLEGAQRPDCGAVGEEGFEPSQSYDNRFTAYRTSPSVPLAHDSSHHSVSRRVRAISKYTGFLSM